MYGIAASAPSARRTTTTRSTRPAATSSRPTGSPRATTDAGRHRGPAVLDRPDQGRRSRPTLKPMTDTYPPSCSSPARSPCTTAAPGTRPRSRRTRASRTTSTCAVLPKGTKQAVGHPRPGQRGLREDQAPRRRRWEFVEVPRLGGGRGHPGGDRHRHPRLRAARRRLGEVDAAVRPAGLPGRARLRGAVPDLEEHRRVGDPERPRSPRPACRRRRTSTAAAKELADADERRAAEGSEPVQRAAGLARAAARPRRASPAASARTASGSCGLLMIAPHASASRSSTCGRSSRSFYYCFTKWPRSADTTWTGLANYPSLLGPSRRSPVAEEHLRLHRRTSLVGIPLVGPGRGAA